MRKRVALILAVSLLIGAFPAAALAGGEKVAATILRLGSRANTLIGAVFAYKAITDYANEKGCTRVRDGQKVWDVGCTLEAFKGDLNRASSR